nr:MAG TPA: hypothetical protein [Caudoviricetes sp.]
MPAAASYCTTLATGANTARSAPGTATTPATASGGRLAPGPSRGTGRCRRRPQKAAMTRCWQMSGPQNRPG